jgi:molecular chaperone DnaJ
LLGGGLFSFLFDDADEHRRAEPTRGGDLRLDILLDWRTARDGAQQQICVCRREACTACTGSGVASGSARRTCGTCSGTGAVEVTVSMLFGSMQRTVRCPTCDGARTVVEQYCGACSGTGVVETPARKLTLVIPPGVCDGNELLLRGHGHAGPRGLPNGDLRVCLRVEPDPNRGSLDLYTDSFEQVARAGRSLVDAVASVPGSLAGAVSLLPGFGRADADVPRGAGRDAAAQGEQPPRAARPHDSRGAEPMSLEEQQRRLDEVERRLQELSQRR